MYDYHVSAHTVYNNGDKLTKDADVSGDVFIFRPVYYVDYGFLNLHGGQQVLFFAKDIEVNSGRISGLSDMLYSPEIWFYRDATNKILLGFIPHLTIPIGEYDEDRPGLSAGKPLGDPAGAQLHLRRHRQTGAGGHRRCPVLPGQQGLRRQRRQCDAQAGSPVHDRAACQL
ncbi:MAG: transporter [Proteobacteria bacterium]|nr:transporter [Pseudomonadota bacterium]